MLFLFLEGGKGREFTVSLGYALGVELPQLLGVGLDLLQDIRRRRHLKRADGNISGVELREGF